MPFKIAHATKLSLPTAYATADEAVVAGRAQFPGDPFDVVEYRAAMLKDFISLTAVIGDVRIAMQEKCKRTDALDSEEFMQLQPMMDDFVGQALDAFDEEMVLATAQSENKWLEGYDIVVKVIHVPVE